MLHYCIYLLNLLFDGYTFDIYIAIRDIAQLKRIKEFLRILTTPSAIILVFY